MNTAQTEEPAQRKPRVPYQIYHRRDGSVMLVRSLNGGCERIFGVSEGDVVSRLRNNTK